MSQDSTNNLPVIQDALEKKLINALTRLQHTAFDNEFLDDKAKATNELPPESFLGFVIGQYGFIVQAKCFCEVFVDTPIAALPNAPACLAGLSNIRGVLMPIYQLHSSLNIHRPKKSTIFCIGKGDAAIGILIDELPVSLSLSAQQRRQTVECKDAVLQPLIKSSYLANQREWFLVDGYKFAEQLQVIANQSYKTSSTLKQAQEHFRGAHI